MKWLSEYNTGIARIDQQHKKMVHMINRLQESITTDVLNQQISSTLKFLISYTNHHFADEEEIMRSISYPEYVKHKELHQDLVNDIKKLLFKLKTMKQINVTELVDFLIKWLKTHIIEEDLKIGEFIHELQKNKKKVQPFSQGSEKEILLNKLIELKDMLAKELILEEDFSNKKEHLVQDYLDLQNVESKGELVKIFNYLRELFNKKTITREDYRNFQKQLFERINLNILLDKIKEDFEKIEFIKYLAEHELITRKKFKKYKEQLLKDIL